MYDMSTMDKWDIDHIFIESFPRRRQQMVLTKKKVNTYKERGWIEYKRYTATFKTLHPNGQIYELELNYWQFYDGHTYMAAKNLWINVKDGRIYIIKDFEHYEQDTDRQSEAEVQFFRLPGPELDPEYQEEEVLTQFVNSVSCSALSYAIANFINSNTTIKKYQIPGMLHQPKTF